MADRQRRPTPLRTAPSYVRPTATLHGRALIDSEGRQCTGAGEISGREKGVESRGREKAWHALVFVSFVAPESLATITRLGGVAPSHGNRPGGASSEVGQDHP
jgi:hypothetical protein